ncbi:MAG: hypothetical protein L0H29_00475 [Sinobacteraceae bacterium]|nr:hypothetical protein [Nevskiaceae bacterium]
MKFRAHAPGKLVLLGEYCVLEGAPAIVMAANRRALAEVETRADTVTDVCELLAPDIKPQPARFHFDGNGAPRWHDAADATRFGLVSAILSALHERGGLPDTVARIRLDSSAFFDATDGVSSKLGLGSSAAVATSLTAALIAASGHPQLLEDRSLCLRFVLDVHRKFQGGRGSGLDLAASLYGGEILFRPAAGCPSVNALRWPEKLHRIYVWSGHSASTKDFLAHLDEWRAGAARSYSTRMQALGAAAEAGADAARAGDAGRLLDALANGAEELRKLGTVSKIPIFSPEHESISALVAAAGGVYKPCGAGGGDVGLAVVAEQADPDRVCAALDAGGYRVVDLDTDYRGLVVDS